MRLLTVRQTQEPPTLSGGVISISLWNTRSAGLVPSTHGCRNSRLSVLVTQSVEIITYVGTIILCVMSRLDARVQWSDTYNIFHAEQQCPQFSSSLDISVTGTAQITSQFGYYLEATIVPPSIQQAYVFFDAGAGAQASFTITGLAEAHYGSGRQELATFGFPGLYYPGLLTLGPSLHLYGELTGQLSLSGRYTATVGYTFPVCILWLDHLTTNLHFCFYQPISYAFGLADSNPDEASSSKPIILMSCNM